MRAPTVRLAEDADAERVRRLVQTQHNSMDETLVWENIAPYWLIAEQDGEIVGALQTCPSRPVGRLEMLSIARHLSKTAKGPILIALAYAGMAVMRGHGAQQVQMFVPEELQEYRDILMARGAEVLDTGFMLAKRIV